MFTISAVLSNINPRHSAQQRLSIMLPGCQELFRPSCRKACSKKRWIGTLLASSQPMHRHSSKNNLPIQIEDIYKLLGQRSMILEHQGPAFVPQRLVV